MFLVGWFATKFIGLGMGQKAAQALSWLLSIIIVALVLFAVGWFVVDKIGDARENKLRLEAAEQTIENRGIADTADAGLESADAADEEKLEEAIDDAVDKDPEAAARPAGGVSNAAARELREQRRRTGNRE